MRYHLIYARARSEFSRRKQVANQAVFRTTIDTVVGECCTTGLIVQIMRLQYEGFCTRLEHERLY